jgi:hypothetical protein
MAAIEKKYDYVGGFHQGVAIVVKDGMYGAILLGGHEIIAPSYDYISSFQDGYANAIKNGIFFVLNLSGNMCVKDGSDYIEIPSRYQQARDFKDGLCCVCHDEKWGAIDKNGHEVIPTQYDYLSDFTKGIAIYRISSRDNIGHKYLFGFLNKSGAVFPAIYDSIWVDDTTGYIHTEYIERLIADDEKRIYNHPKRLDSNGSFVAKNGLKYIALKNKYDYVEDFSNGVSIVRRDGLCGAIDIYENIVVPIKYDFLYTFKTNVTIGGIKEVYGNELTAEIIQSDGKIIGSVEHISEITPIEGDVSIFCVNKKTSGWKSHKKYGIVNTSGVILLEAEYDEIRKEKNNVFRIVEKHKIGLFDIIKGWIIPCKFDDISTKENMFVVQIKQLGSFNFNLLGKCFVLNNGKCVELPDFCFVGRDFVNGYAPIAMGEKWGIIDSSFNIILGAKYDNIKNIFRNVYKISQKEGWADWRHGLYNLKKGEILSPKYKNVEMLTSSIFIFGEESGSEHKFDKYGIVDLMGKIILPQTYYDIKFKDDYFFLREFKNGYANSSIQSSYYEKNQSLIANSDGKIIIKSQYTFVNVINKDWAITNNHSLFGFVNLHTKKEYVPSFDEIEVYEDGILLARKDELVFYLNNEARKVVKKGETWESIPDDIYWMGEFHDGIARVLIDKNAPEGIFVDESYRLVIFNGHQRITLPSHTTYVYPFDNETNCSIIKYGNAAGLINRNGDVICTPKYGEIERYSDSLTTFLCKNNKGKYGVLRLKEGNKSTEEIIGCVYSNISKVEEDDDYTNEEYGDLPELFQLEENGKIGVANCEGKIIIPCDYSKVLLHERRWLMLYKEKQDTSSNEEKVTKSQLYRWSIHDDYLIGLADIHGNIITQPKYGYIQYLGGNLFSVCQGNFIRGGKWGVMQTDGELLIPMIYDNIDTFDGTYISVEYNKHHGYVNTECIFAVKDEEGIYLPIKTTCDFVCDFDGSKAVAFYKGHQGYVNTKGEILVKKLVPDGYDYELDEYDHKTVYLTLPNQYDWAFDFVGDYAIVISRNKYGIINSAFESIVPPIYDKLEIVKKDNRISFVKVTVCDKLGIINNSFEEIIPPKYDIIEIVENNSYYSFICNINKKQYLADERGIILCEFDSLLDEETESIKGMNPAIHIAGLSVELVPNEYQYGLGHWTFGEQLKGITVVKKQKDSSNSSKSLYGCINEFGDLILPIKYSGIVFSNGFIVAEEKTDKADYYRAYDKQGNLLFSSNNESFQVICRGVYIKESYSGGNGYKLFFVNEQEVKTLEGESSIVSWEIINYLIKARLDLHLSRYLLDSQYYDGYVYGIVSKQGNVIIPFEYKGISDCVDGCFAAYDHFRNEDSKVFDEFGNIIFSTHYNVYNIICRNVYVASGKLLFVKPDRIVEIDTKYHIRIDECKIDDEIIQVCTDSQRYDDEGDIKFYGVFTKQGKTLLPLEYRAIGDFIDGYAIVKNSKYYGVINSNYELIIPCVYDEIEFDKRTGLFQTKINVIRRYSRLYFRKGKNPFEPLDSEWNDIVMFRTKAGRNIVFHDGENLLFDSKYMHIGKFVNDVAIVNIVKDNRLYYGMINKKGETVLPTIYSFIQRFNNGMFKCCLNGRVGILNEKGDYIIPNQFLSVGEYENGLSLIVESVDGTYSKDSLREYGYMDLEGNIVLSSCSYISKQSEGLSVVCRKGVWGFFNILERKTTKVEGSSYVGLPHDDLAKANYGGTYTQKDVIGGKWGFVDKNGNIVINPTFDYVYNFSEGIAAVKIGDKYGFIDTAGVLIVPCEYDEVKSHFEEDEGKLIKGDKVYVFNRIGELVSDYYKENNEGNDYDSLEDNSPSIYDNPYYNDNLDMDQQSIEFWNSL